VVLVGNKIDLRGDHVTNQSLEEEIIPIMNEFKVYIYIISHLTCVYFNDKTNEFNCHFISRK